MISERICSSDSEYVLENYLSNPQYDEIKRTEDFKRIIADIQGKICLQYNTSSNYKMHSGEDLELDIACQTYLGEVVAETLPKYKYNIKESSDFQIHILLIIGSPIFDLSLLYLKYIYLYVQCTLC